MEDTLRGWENLRLILIMKPSLNPCFNGRYSQRGSHRSLRYHYQVLILVLMEDTLRVLKLITLMSVLSLNPCFNGRYSQRAKTGVTLFIVV